MGEITVTLKYGPGHDAPWVVFRGETPEEMTAYLDSTQDLFPAVGRAQGAFKAETTLGEILGARAVGSTPNVPAAAAPAAQAAPAPGVRTCPHGTKVYKSGISQKTQKPWGRYDCPLPRGDANACPAEWAN